MPSVTIGIANEGATAERKAALIKGATELLVDVLNKNPDSCVVVIDEVETDDWVSVAKRDGQAQSVQMRALQGLISRAICRS